MEDGQTRRKEEILNEWNDITKNIQADIVVLDMPLLDTTQYKDSLGTFIADLVLQILSWMAEEERDRIKFHKVVYRVPYTPFLLRYR
jgi:hypothetical protein